MKSIIKISFLLLFMFLATNSFAQGAAGSSIEKRVNRLTEYLELDANQKAAITDVFSEYGNQLKTLRLQQTKGKTEDKTAYRKVLKKQDEALLNVFNDAQKTKYTNLRRGNGKMHEGQGKENEMEKRARKNNRKTEANGKYAKKKSQPVEEEYLIEEPFE